MSAQSVSDDWIETNRENVEAELERLLKQKRFAGAAQMSAFLRYIVTETLNGNGDRIKAYTVGVDALGKPETFDAQNDPSVRVLALRLRKSLTASYEQDHGVHRARIVLTVGTYVPQFFKAEQGFAASAEQGAGAIASDTESLALGTAHANLPSRSERVAIDQAEPPASSPVHIEQPKETATGSAKTESAESPLRGGSWLLSGVMLLIIVGLSFSGSRNDSFANQSLNSSPQLQFASVTPGKDLDDTSSHSADSAIESVPVLYIQSNEAQTEHAHQVATLLGASIVQQGIINVVRAPAIGDEAQPYGRGYWMTMEEIQLDNQPTLVLQLIRQDSGAVVMSTSLTLDSPGEGFSKEEMLQIDALGKALSMSEGPLMKDHCARATTSVAGQCLQGAIAVVSN